MSYFSHQCDCECEYFNPTIEMYECPSCGATWEAEGVTFGEEEDDEEEDDD